MPHVDSGPLRQAYALAYAMQARPTPALATAYFAALKRVIDAPSAPTLRVERSKR